MLYTLKIKFFSEKKEKYPGLLSALIFELFQMNSDKIMDRRVGFRVKLFIHFMKISW